MISELHHVYLGVQFTTDLVAGVALGALMAVTTVSTARRAAFFWRLLLPT